MSKNLVILIVSLSFSCFAQKSNVSQFNYDGSEFSSGVNKFIKESGHLATYFSTYLSLHYMHVTDSLCTSGVAMIKFKFSNKHISGISCSKETPLILAKIYKEAIEKSSRYWTIPKNASEEDWYVLPFHYNYSFNCNEKMEGHQVRDLFEFDDGTNLHEKKIILLTSGGCYHGKADTDDLNGMPKKKP